MKLFVGHCFSCFILLVGIVSFCDLSSTAQNPSMRYWEMKGTQYQHLFIDHSDSLSAQQIFELCDENGIPVWFGRDIRKVVCLTGQCRMVHVWLFWDGAGNYLGFQEHQGDPLTKTDHTVFSVADKQKLHRILGDSVSVLKNLKQEELIIKPDKTDQKVDAVSRATQPSLQEYLVKNAAYTCYTLWHTVYGGTRDEILRILEKRADKEYLKLIFECNNPEYLRWAIGFIGRHSNYHADFYPQIIELIKSKNETVSGQALAYFSKVRLSDIGLQKELIQVFEDFSYQRKFELLWKLAEVKRIDDEVIVHLLDLFENDQINASLLGYVYKLIRPGNLEDSRIRKKLESLATHKNLYVRNITWKVLESSK